MRSRVQWVAEHSQTPEELSALLASITPQILRLLEEAVLLEDVCLVPLDDFQICGVRQAHHREFMGDSHYWNGPPVRVSRMTVT